MPLSDRVVGFAPGLVRGKLDVTTGTTDFSPPGPPEGGWLDVSSVAEDALKRDVSDDLEDALQDAQEYDSLGYLDGLAQFSAEPDADQWNASYDPTSDSIHVEGKFEGENSLDKVRTLLHEAGHRGQYLKDKALYEDFKKRGLDRRDWFLEMANKTHVEDYVRSGHVDDLPGEVFAESYARHCLGLELPDELAEFWDERMAAMDDFKEGDHPRGQPGNAGQFAPKGGGGGGTTTLEKIKEDYQEITGYTWGAYPGKEKDFMYQFYPDFKGETTGPEVHPDKTAKFSAHVPFVDLRTKLKGLIASNANHTEEGAKKVESLARQLVHGYSLKIKELLKAGKQSAVEAAIKKATKYSKHLPHKERNELKEFLKNPLGSAPAQQSETLGNKLAQTLSTKLAQVKASTAPVAPGKATPAELEKAKKSVALKLQYLGVEGAPDNGVTQGLINEFNKKYEGKALEGGALEAKVADFKQLKAKVEKYTKESSAEIAKEQAAKNQAAATALAKSKAESAAKNAELMKELGISSVEAQGFEALADMMGSSTKDLVAQFKSLEQTVKNYGYPMTGFQAALIKNYTNGGYGSINQALRSGKWSAKQHVYAKLMNAALDKMPKFEGTVKRGTHLTAEQLSSYEVGHVTVEHAFTSTGEGFNFGGNVKYTIKAIGKRAVSIKKLSNHKSENEVLFKANTFFLCTGKTTSGSTTHIQLEEVEGYE